MAERRFVYFYSMFCSAIFCLHLFIFHSGVDLKMVTFSCVPTGDRQGIMEMVTNAKTLREIHVTGNQGFYVKSFSRNFSWNWFTIWFTNMNTEQCFFFNLFVSFLLQALWDLLKKHQYLTIWPNGTLRNLNLPLRLIILPALVLVTAW